MILFLPSRKSYNGCTRSLLPSRSTLFSSCLSFLLLHSSIHPLESAVPSTTKEDYALQLIALLSCWRTLRWKTFSFQKTSSSSSPLSICSRPSLSDLCLECHKGIPQLSCCIFTVTDWNEFQRAALKIKTHHSSLSLARNRIRFFHHLLTLQMELIGTFSILSSFSPRFRLMMMSSKRYFCTHEVEASPHLWGRKSHPSSNEES